MLPFDEPVAMADVREAITIKRNASGFHPGLCVFFRVEQLSAVLRIEHGNAVRKRRPDFVVVTAGQGSAWSFARRSKRCERQQQRRPSGRSSHRAHRVAAN